MKSKLLKKTGGFLMIFFGIILGLSQFSSIQDIVKNIFNYGLTAFEIGYIFATLAFILISFFLIVNGNKIIKKS